MQKKRLKGGVSMEKKITNDYFEEKRYVCNLYAVTEFGFIFLERYTISFRNFENCRDVSKPTGNHGIFTTENMCVFNEETFNPFSREYWNTLDSYLKEPNVHSYIKELVDRAGIREKIRTFFLSYDSFTLNSCGELIVENPWYRIVDDL